MKTGLGVYVKLKKHTKTLLESMKTGLGVYVKLKKHTKTVLKPTKTGLGVVLGSYGGSMSNSKNLQKPMYN
jgi:hypothetical protein